MAYIEVKDISQLYNKSEQYIRRLLTQGKLPGKKIGNTWMVDESVLELELSEHVNRNTKVEDYPRKDVTIPEHIALSFFSGAMGLDIGLEEAGLEVLLASEIDNSTRQTISKNKKNIGLIGDIRDYPSSKILEYANLPEGNPIDLMVGGPPCQAFSTAGSRRGFEDERGNVFLTFIERILEIRPRFAVIENVRGLLSAPLKHRPHSRRGFGYPPLTPEEDKGGALYHIIKMLEEGGYSVSFNLYNSTNFGSPQKRERLVMICGREEQAIPFLEPTHSENGEFGLSKWKTFSDVSHDLIEEEQEYLEFPESRLKYYRLLKSGQYWKHLPEDLHKEALGASFYAGGGRTGFLRRLGWDKPSPTLVTNPTMPATDLAHPEKDRPISVQEYMRVQEFPDDWELSGNTSDKYRQIGNAVPVSLGMAIGKHLLKLLNGSPIQEYEGFKYSRYKNTDYDSFLKLMEKRKKIEEEETQQLLFAN